MFSSAVMLQRTVASKTAPCFSRFLSLTRISKFSESASTKNDDSSNADDSQNKHLDEMPVGEENIARLLKEAATYSDAKDKSWATTPYPEGAPTSVEEETKPKVDPCDTSVIIFPGQGIIKVGTVKKYLHFPQVKELFEIANEILDYNILKLCLKGPQEKLDQTRYNQPATVLTSLAALEKLREERPMAFDTCMVTAGYSVGELTALMFSGALSFEDGIRLVAVRGAAMQYAADKSPQGMLSVFCSATAKLSEALKDAQNWALDNGVSVPVCQVAVYLYTSTKILAGSEEALQYIQKNGEKYGLRRMTRLPVSGAFHTKLMEPALKSFYKTLNTLDIVKPSCQVYSNYKGQRYRNPDLIKKYLPKQIVSPVRWEQTMQYIYSRPEGTAFPRTFDVGSEGRMKTILKLTNAKAYDNCITV